MGNISDNFKKKYNQWSRRRCNNKIITVLSNGQLATLKMAVVWPYLLTEQNRFRADTSRHWEEFTSTVLTKFLQWFRRRCDNGENRSHFRACTTIPLGEHRMQILKKNPTSGLVGDAITGLLQQGSYTLDIHVLKFPDFSLTRIQISLTFFVDIDYPAHIILPSKLEN